jgi:hypothetical protein
MIQDLDKTLEKLVFERGKLPRTDFDVSFNQPTREWSSKLNRPTINLWLYDLRENAKLRSKEMVIERQRERGRVEMRPVPLRFSVNYLVTAWTSRVEDEHWLLWRALAALCGLQTLNPDDCEGALQRQPYDIPFQVAQEGDSALSFVDLWSVLDNDMRPGFTLAITLALDTEFMLDMPMVREGRIVFGQAEQPLDQEITMPEDFDLAVPRAEENQIKNALSDLVKNIRQK